MRTGDRAPWAELPVQSLQTRPRAVLARPALAAPPGSAGCELRYLANEETVHGPSAATGRQGMKSVLDEVCA